MAADEHLKDRIRQNHPDRLRIFWLLRYELKSEWTNFAAWCSPRNRRNIRRLRGERGLKVHIASGPYPMKGWVNVDVVPSADVRMDLRRPLPFATESVSMIFCEHFLDHLQYPDVAGRFLAECYRVLEPGGRFRLVLHDLERLLRAYVERDEAFFRDAQLDQPARAERINDIMRHNSFHQFFYDFETLGALLHKVGFETVKRTETKGSEVPELNLDNPSLQRTSQSMYVEAIKGNLDAPAAGR